jgi:hypothetical protein
MMLHDDLAHHVELAAISKLLVPLLGFLYFQYGLLARLAEAVFQVLGLVLVGKLDLFLKV